MWRFCEGIYYFDCSLFMLFISFFIQTDIQSLLNDGASLADISASVLHAVVMQTIAGLACGRPIKG
jgi:hypothetical protein